MKKTILHNTAGKNLATRVLLSLALTLLVAAPVHAGVVRVSFGATISNDGGITTDDIFGEFRLDDSLPFGIDIGAVDDIILSGSFTSMSGTSTADTGQPFTFVTAAIRPVDGYGVLSLIGDYGGGLFALDLANDLWFGTTNAFDVLQPGLSLASLRSFNTLDLDTTRFVNLVGYNDEWEGALTFLNIVVNPEPGTLSLMLLMVPGLIYWRRRRA